MKDCASVRDALSRENLESDELRAHLDHCPACADLEELWMAYRDGMDKRQLDVDLGPAFATRILARVEDPWMQLGWGALRLLPVAFSLVLVLSWAAWTAPTPSLRIDTEGFEEEVLLTLLFSPSEEESP